MKRRLAFVLAGIALVCCVAADSGRLREMRQWHRRNRDWQPKFFKPGSQPRGFRDIPWGVKPGQLDGLRPVRHECAKDLEAYARASDRLRIGKAQISRIRWCFLVKPIAGLDMEWPVFSNRLVRVDIELRGEMDFQIVKKACMCKYGNISESGTSEECDVAAECYVWQGDTTAVRLRKLSQRTSIALSKPLYELMFESIIWRFAHTEAGRDIVPSSCAGGRVSAEERQAEKETEEAMRDL